MRIIYVDSVFILKSLATAGYRLTGKWRENDLISLKIYGKERKLNVKLLDSFKFLPDSLDKLLMDVVLIKECSHTNLLLKIIYFIMDLSQILNIILMSIK